jgi:hypothetical protein
MKYEEPNMELLLLQSREVFMTASTVTGTGGGDGDNFGNDSPNGDDFD